MRLDGLLAVFIEHGAKRKPDTLRQAITDANASPGTDRILIQSGVPQITLASELVITDCVWISGLGSTQKVISGNNSVRVFNVQPDIDVSFSFLNIQGGHPPANNFGGGIYNKYSNVAVDQCVVTNNTADLGGGIYNDGHSPDGSVTAATLTVTNSTISGNTATNTHDSGRIKPPAATKLAASTQRFLMAKYKLPNTRKACGTSDIENAEYII